MKKNYILTIFFIMFIFLFLIISLFNEDKTFSLMENRNLQQIPEINKNKIFDGSFQEEYETYVNDQMILRDNFVKLSTKTKLLLGQKEINDVYINNDYLIEKFNKNNIKEDEINKNIEYLKSFIKNNPNVKIGIIPTASGVLTQYLPIFADKLNEEEYINSIYEQFGRKNSIDFSTILKEHKEEEIFYKTDHHWTTLGAYYGYLEICKSLNIEPITIDKYTSEIVDNEFSGMIQSQLNIDFENDTIVKYVPKFNVQYERILNEDKKTISDSLYDYDKLKTKEKYAIFLGGNNAVTRIKTNSETTNGKKLLMIKDSFSHCLVPFLANNYSEIVLLDLRYYMGGVNRFLNNEKFDDIIIMYNLKNFANNAMLVSLNK